jgi:hypothetical protein
LIYVDIIHRHDFGDDFLLSLPALYTVCILKNKQVFTMGISKPVSIVSILKLSLFLDDSVVELYGKILYCPVGDYTICMGILLTGQ